MNAAAAGGSGARRIAGEVDREYVLHKEKGEQEEQEEAAAARAAAAQQAAQQDGAAAGAAAAGGGVLDITFEVELNEEEEGEDGGSRQSNRWVCEGGLLPSLFR